MAGRPSIQVNVPPAPARQSSDMTNGACGLGQLSPDRALQFTPFAQSVIPLSDRIPFPQPARVLENGRVATSQERAQARLLFQQPNTEATIRNKVVDLLSRPDITPYDFRLPPAAASNRSTSTVSNLGLSPLARSVLNMTKPDYRYPTPDEDNETTLHKSAPRAKMPGPLPTPTEPKLKPDQQPTQDGTPVKKPTPNKVVVQVPAPDSFRREDYVTVTDSPKRRKVSHDGTAPQNTRTQKQLSDEALQSFQDLLNDVFEAQDLVDGSGGDTYNFKSTPFFEDLDNGAESGLTLNSQILARLREDLRKLLNLRRLTDVPADAMRRLHDICEPAIEKCQTLNLRPSFNSEDDQGQWRTRLHQADNGLSSAIVALYIMLGHSQDESWISTEVLRWTSNALVNVLESCLIPIIEARPDSTDTNFWKSASSSVDSVKQVLSTTKRLLELIGTACVDVKGGESSVNAIEFLAAKLIFVQNASNEKNSVLGLQVYENFRKTAMATLSKIYARFPRERQAILDEILSSLDKSPSTSRSARTFKAGENQSIQLISALFMQLVQTTAMELPKQKSKKVKKVHQKKSTPPDSDKDVNDDGHVSEDDEDDTMDENESFVRLDRKVNQLFQPASKSAQGIVQFLVDKASKTTKTGDSPYRNILDLLVEDLIAVVDLPDWPSSEFLLNVLAAIMLDMAKNAKTASAKNMALESLGVMGSAISKLRDKLPAVVTSLKSAGSGVSQQLIRLSETHKQQGGLQHSAFAMSGPFVMVADHFLSMSGKITLHQQSARGWFAAYFAFLVSQTTHNPSVQLDLSDVVDYVLNMLSMSGEFNALNDVSPNSAKAVYLLCVLNLPFCQRLSHIVKALSSSLTSEQAQVKSRSLKSISVILESDSSLLDRDQSVADDVFKCASDDSAMVRDSALSLIARFIISRGGILEKRGMERLLECAGDEKVGVQKRALGHLKDIYLQDQRPALKNRILQVILKRLNDPEDSIVSLAEQILEDILIRPAANLVQSSDQTAAAVVAVDDLAAGLMACVTTGAETFVPLVKKLILMMLRYEKKSFASNRQLAVRLVYALFEKIIATEKTRAPLLVLTALAEADPKLVPPLQLSKLQVYLSDLQKGSDGDLFMFRSAVTIFRLVLPDLSDTHKNLLREIQDRLMQAVQKLGRRLELDAVMQCLTTIDGVLQNTDRLVRFGKSVLEKLAVPEMKVETRIQLLQIAGAFGKHTEVDRFTTAFRGLMPVEKFTSVSALMVKTILPLTAEQLPLNLRLTALESLGAVCQAYPAHLNKAPVKTTLFDILRLSFDSSAYDNQKLIAVVLNIFDELFATRAAAKEQSSKTQDGEEQALKQMGGDVRSQEQDSAINTITPDVTDAVLRISLSASSENILPAARTLASISHQGLIHPKHCLGAFVAFGTSKDQKIATIGHRAQQLLHEQHESHCEREYMSAIFQAFEYQYGVESSPFGAVSNGAAGFKPKLGPCFDIIMTSNSKYIKKFLSGLVSRTIIDSSTAEKSMPSPEHVMYTRFVMQNIAFFDYKRLDELLHVALQLELAYGKSVEIAALVEAAQEQHQDLLVHEHTPGNTELGIVPSVVENKATNPALIVEMKRLGSAAATLALMIETRAHLLRQYGVSRDVRTAMMNTKQAKDTAKPPVKVHGITGDRFWTKSNEIVSALESDLGVVQLCKTFVSAMSIDDDVELTTGDGTANRDTPVYDGNVSMPAPSATPGGRKRKLNPTPGTTPTKRPRGRPRKSYARRSSSVSTNDDPQADFDG
ncbi:Sister chromatid cohesion protein 2 [Lithohypha guttulata]|uniref:Sister chromatid cohesion protein 2 n=1 Tax=Lithohypha guttulata TaxID=1690604 RepID=UPI002DE01E93|nr:Sister chromatid cohesion protein 2 [Lithohypha guttulata]